jgi:hypothetical protein
VPERSRRHFGAVLIVFMASALINGATEERVDN